MPVRRLLIVMLILLGLSTLAAALVPSHPVRNGGTDSTAVSVASTATDTLDAAPKGKNELGVTAKVGNGPIKVIPIHVGDQIALILYSKRADELEIPALGLVEAVGPNLPARFDLLITQAGDYGIRYVEADRVVARITVKARKGASAQPAP
jgi:hypothetical protein